AARPLRGDGACRGGGWWIGLLTAHRRRAPGTGGRGAGVRRAMKDMTDRTRRDDMRKGTRGLVAVVAVAISTISLTAPRAALAAAGVDEDANAALKKLYASEPAAKLLSEKAKAI